MGNNLFHDPTPHRPRSPWGFKLRTFGHLTRTTASTRPLNLHLGTHALADLAEESHSNWIAMRRHLHQHPELSNQEYATTEYLASSLRSLDIPFRVIGDGRGVTADLVTSPSVADGPRLGIRGDIDALPIADTKSVIYRSHCEGVMHACGHDVHATVIFGAMQLLCEMHRNRRLPWPVSVRAIFQPSEEVATGARYMIHHHAHSRRGRHPCRPRRSNAKYRLHRSPQRRVNRLRRHGPG